MPICGPKLSACCLVLGIWGIIQLGLMGVFFYIHSVAFADDIMAEFKDDYDKFTEEVDTSYRQSALNCWIAALMYTGITVLSAHQLWANTRANKV